MPPEPKPPGSSPSGTATPPLDPQLVKGIFVEALNKETGQPRADFLDQACAGNDQLRSRVEGLLRAYDDAGSFLQHPAGDWRNPPVTATAASPTVEVDDHGIPHGLLHRSDNPHVLGTIGPYEVRELIGRGGMGIVLRAFDAKLNRVVAIKVLSPSLAAQPTARRRFLREAQAAAAVAHPHVVTIYAVDEDEWPYLVMECIEGTSLQEKIEHAGALKLTEVLRIGTQIAEGLAAAHKQGLIHRDVKPANILLENGVQRVRITDFGLARAADDVSITRTGEISGTPQYMSPEQASGERVDQRSDLFSLGCVLYEMCAGEPPFRADSMAAIVKKICNDEPQPLREIDQQIPDWLASTIDRLLAKDPQQRFQTADEVAAVLGNALSQVQAGQAVTAPVVHASVAVPVEASSPLPAWLGVVVIGLVGYWFGRLMPLRIMEHSTNEGWIIGAAVVCVSLLAFWIARLRPMPSTFGVILVVCALMAFFLASAFGRDQMRRHGLHFDGADWLVTSLALLPIVAAALAWRNRRSWWYPLIQRERARHVALREGQSRRAANDASDFRPAARSWFVHVWKCVTWFVVVLLSLTLLPSFLAATDVVLPNYQRYQSALMIVATVLGGYLLVSYLVWMSLRLREVPWLATRPTGPSPQQPTGRSAGQSSPIPFKVTWWMVLAILSIVLVLPCVGIIGSLVVSYQPYQAHPVQEARTAAILTLTFDEDLPIVAIRIDDVPPGPIDISPVKTSLSAGPHAVTVIYAHGERNRSVRETVKLAPYENRTLDLTPLVLADIKRRDLEKHKVTNQGEAEKPSVAPAVIRKIKPSDEPLSTSAKWVGDELEVVATEAAPVRLFEVPLDRIDQSIIAYRFRIKAEDLATGAWADMLCRVPRFGEFYVRRFDQRVVQGDNDWMTIETPFILHKDQFADLLKLNLVFEGPGKVRLKDIEVLTTPLAGEPPTAPTTQKDESSSTPPGDKNAGIEPEH